MVVPEQVKNCVAFVYYNGEGGLLPAGTAFFIGTELGEGRVWLDVVTARHVIAGIRSKATDDSVYLRVNLATGGSTMTRTPLSGWELHPDPTIDVALLGGIDISASGLDVVRIPPRMILTDELIKKHEIGVGDEVFLTGLFSNHHRTERCIPIVRVGNIAAMPEEPIHTALGKTPAYLIECRSIGGLSGSPVFVNLGFARGVGGQVKFASEGRPIFYLLGLIHGHYDVSAELRGSAADMAGLRDERINMGIAIVVPIARVMDLITRPGRMVESAEDGSPTA